MLQQTTQGPAPPPTSPFFDPSGRIAPAWYVFLQSMGANMIALQQSFINFSSYPAPPIVSGLGGMNISGLAVQEARFQQTGNVVTVYVAVTFTTGGTPSPYVLISTPVAPVGPPDGGLLTASITDGGQVDGSAILNGAYFQVSKYNGTNWGIGPGRGIILSGSYRAA